MEAYVRQQKKTIGLRNQIREMKKQRKASTKAQERGQLDTQIAIVEKELGKSSAAIYGIEKDPYKIMIKENDFQTSAIPSILHNTTITIRQCKNNDYVSLF